MAPSTRSPVMTRVPGELPGLSVPLLVRARPVVPLATSFRVPLPPMVPVLMSAVLLLSSVALAPIRMVPGLLVKLARRRVPLCTVSVPVLFTEA